MGDVEVRINSGTLGRTGGCCLIADISKPITMTSQYNGIATFAFSELNYEPGIDRHAHLGK